MAIMDYVSNFSTQYKKFGTFDNFRPTLIKDIIEANKVKDKEAQAKWNRYLQSIGSLEIDKKIRSIHTKINNKLKHDFRGEIVSTQTNYFIGRPISYNIRDDEIPERQRLLFTEFVDRNKLARQDQYLAKRLSALGKAGRLYYQLDKKLWMVNLMPYEFKIVKDEITNETLFAIRYYDVETSDKKIRKQVEFYDNQFVYYYTQSDDGENYYEDSYNFNLPETNEDGSKVTQYLHGFTKVPIVEFRNNEEGSGDFDRVETLIDAYDRIASSDLDDLEDIRDSLLFLKRMKLDPSQMQQLRDAKLIQTMDELADARYISKAIGDTRLADTINRLKDNIYRISRTVDFSDEKFSGAAQSGESRKYKLLAMDNNRLDKIASFEYGLDEQLEVLVTGWRMLHGIEFNPHGISYDFQANIPNDETYWAELAQKLNGIISKRSIIDILPSSIVENTDEELKRIEEEQDDYLSSLYRTIDNDSQEPQATN